MQRNSQLIYNKYNCIQPLFSLRTQIHFAPGRTKLCQMCPHHIKCSGNTRCVSWHCIACRKTSRLQISYQSLCRGSQVKYLYCSYWYLPLFVISKAGNTAVTLSLVSVTCYVTCLCTHVASSNHAGECHRGKATSTTHRTLIISDFRRSVKDILALP